MGAVLSTARQHPKGAALFAAASLFAVMFGWPLVVALAFLTWPLVLPALLFVAVSAHVAHIAGWAAAAAWQDALIN